MTNPTMSEYMTRTASNRVGNHSLLGLRRTATGVGLFDDGGRGRCWVEQRLFLNQRQFAAFCHPDDRYGCERGHEESDCDRHHGSVKGAIDEAPYECTACCRDSADDGRGGPRGSSCRSQRERVEVG